MPDPTLYRMAAYISWHLLQPGGTQASAMKAFRKKWPSQGDEMFWEALDLAKHIAEITKAFDRDVQAGHVEALKRAEGG